MKTRSLAALLLMLSLSLVVIPWTLTVVLLLEKDKIEMLEMNNAALTATLAAMEEDRVRCGCFTLDEIANALGRSE